MSELDVDDGAAATQSAVMRGRQASNELQLTDEAFLGLREAAIAEIVKSGPGQDNRDKVERLIVCIQMLGAVQAMLKSAVNAGDAAKKYAELLAEATNPRPE